jgi:hypothetical protein
MIGAKRKTAVVALLLAGCRPLSATTVVVLKTQHGIVITTDSQATKTTSDFLDLGKGTTKKSVIVQDRFVVATIGHQDFWTDSSGGPEYHFSAWMKQLSAGLPSDITVEQFANLIYTESSKLLASVEPALKRGVLKRKYPGDFCDSFIQYVIIGYQGGAARVYVVQSYIDWDGNQLTNRPPSLRSFDSDVGFYVFGFDEALTEVLNRKSYAYEQAMIRSPKAFGDLLAERDLPLSESISFAKALIQIEEKVNPSSVSGNAQAIIVLPNGRASEVSPRKGTLGTDRAHSH